MTKVSKKDQDHSPEAIAAADAARAEFKAKKCQHFTLNSYVLCNGLRGQITAVTKDGTKMLGPTKLYVEWDDGTNTVIDNPNWRGR